MTTVTDQRRSNLLERMCRSKGIKILMLETSRLGQRSTISEEANEIDYLQDVYAGQKLEEGIYIINKKAISIDANGLANAVDLDSIIGQGVSYGLIKRIKFSSSRKQ